MYCIINANLYWEDPLKIFLLCLTKSESEGLIQRFHEGICGGHYAWNETAYKISKAGFYWAKLFVQVAEKMRSCIPCQKFVVKHRLEALPLVPVSIKSPFLHQGLDFIVEIVSTSNNQHRWILTTTSYFTKWVEEIPVKNETNTVAIKFIEEIILSINLGCH